jgi:hypothetical protein
MKKMAVVSALAFLLSAGAHAQIPGIVELGAATQALIMGTKIEEFVYYAQMVKQQIEAAFNTYHQLEAMVRAEQRALQNLAGIASVGSYSDFMDWYNRQLYLERQVEQRYGSIGIQIGGNTYGIADIEKIPGALAGRFADDSYWDDFTEEQRREMWVGLGLTPANYVYQSAWLAKEGSLAQNILTRREVINEENQEAHRRNSDILRLAYKPDVAEKGLLQGLLEMTADTNRAIRELAYDNAEWREYQLAKDRLDKTPSSPGPISDMWGKELFTEPITEGEGVFIDRY